VTDIGETLGGRYRLVELLGQGGMATIYRARDAQLERDVAVKVLRPEYGADPDFNERFRHEAQSAASLNHPNVVSVFDYGTDDVGPFIVMELVEGEDLSAIIRRSGALPPRAAARLVAQAARALSAAHDKGVVHRDVKPGNIMVTREGRVKVADFGIARALSEAALTLPGTTLGSVHYFSPEQARGEPVTTVSDVYSTGLVLYEMLSGHRAFSGGTAAEVAMARLGGRIPSPMEVRPDVPAALDAIVRWALQPDVRSRPSASELASALGRFLADPLGTSTYQAVRTPPGTPTGPHGTTSQAYRATSRGGPGRLGWAAGLLGLFVLVVVGMLLLLSLVSGSGSGQATATPTPASHPPGATAVPAPRFVGMRIEDARVIADRAGIQLDEHERTSHDADPGMVIDQDPVEGGPVPPGGSVKVVVAQPVETVQVPDLRGDTETRAKTRLVEAGLTPTGRFQAYDDEVRKGRVVRTEPAAGTEVAEGTTVAYYVSRGPKPVVPVTPAAGAVTVGDYRCLTLDAAREQLAQAGLAVGTVLPPEPESDGTWLVRDQEPAVGAEVEPGSAVQLWVMDPVEACPA
jgi:serine/threonine-protein kinase